MLAVLELIILVVRRIPKAEVEVYFFAPIFGLSSDKPIFEGHALSLCNASQHQPDEQLIESRFPADTQDGRVEPRNDGRQGDASKMAAKEYIVVGRSDRQVREPLRRHPCEIAFDFLQHAAGIRSLFSRKPKLKSSTISGLELTMKPNRWVMKNNVLGNTSPGIWLCSTCGSERTTEVSYLLTGETLIEARLGGLKKHMQRW